MLNRAALFAFPLVFVVGCPGGDSTNASDSAAATDHSGTTAAVESTGSAETSGLGSTSASNGTGTTASSSPQTTSTSSEGSGTAAPIDPCPVGVGVDWPRHGASLTLANEEDFTEGPLDLVCSINRALEPGELDPGTVSALELTCQLPDESGSSTIYVSTTIPEAVTGLEALVGLQDVTAVLNYGATGLKAVWTEAVVFAIRDEVGPLLLSQWTNCEGEIPATGSACEAFRPSFRLAAGWSGPLPEARLADLDCGTRPWEYKYVPSMGTSFDMTRLALRFETDDGVVDVLDHHTEMLNIEGEQYEFFSTDVVGEVEDPTVFGETGYTQFLSFFIIRTP